MPTTQLHDQVCLKLSPELASSHFIIDLPGEDHAGIISVSLALSVLRACNGAWHGDCAGLAKPTEHWSLNRIRLPPSRSTSRAMKLKVVDVGSQNSCSVDCQSDAPCSCLLACWRLEENNELPHPALSTAKAALLLTALGPPQHDRGYFALKDRQNLEDFIDTSSGCTAT